MATKKATVTKAKAKAPAKAPAPKTKVAEAAPRKKPVGSGRPSVHAGKALTSTQEANPRRKDTIGFKSHAIIMRNPGILYEDFIKKGGRSQDLAWDVERGHVKVG